MDCAIICLNWMNCAKDNVLLWPLNVGKFHPRPVDDLNVVLTLPFLRKSFESARFHCQDNQEAFSIAMQKSLRVCMHYLYFARFKTCPMGS